MRLTPYSDSWNGSSTLPPFFLFDHLHLDSSFSDTLRPYCREISLSLRSPSHTRMRYIYVFYHVQLVKNRITVNVTLQSRVLDSLTHQEVHNVSLIYHLIVRLALGILALFSTFLISLCVCFFLLDSSYFYIEDSELDLRSDLLLPDYSRRNYTATINFTTRIRPPVFTTQVPIGYILN